MVQPFRQRKKCLAGFSEFRRVPFGYSQGEPSHHVSEGDGRARRLLLLPNRRWRSKLVEDCCSRSQFTRSSSLRLAHGSQSGIRRRSTFISQSRWWPELGNGVVR